MAGAGRSSGRRFDRTHSVTTQALLMLGELEKTSRDAYAHATHYEPVPVEAFGELLGRIPEPLVRAAAFVDVGCGMGRAVLLASERPFKQVVGIELSPALHAIACENLANASGLRTRCRDVRIRRGDARRFRYPSGDLVVFLFNPFDDEVLRVVLERIVGTRRAGDRVMLLYHVAVHREVVAEYAGEALYDGPAGLVVPLRVP
jgi:SAM-dependent methyltransferase